MLSSLDRRLSKRRKELHLKSISLRMCTLSRAILCMGRLSVPLDNHWYEMSPIYIFNISLHLSQVLIQHRGSNDALALVENILRPLKSRFVYLSYEEHDLVTANTQAVTHAAFLRYLQPILLLTILNDATIF